MLRKSYVDIVMGNEQSFGEGRLALQRDEDLRSCTTSKPIGTGMTLKFNKSFNAEIFVFTSIK